MQTLEPPRIEALDVEVPAGVVSAPRARRVPVLLAVAAVAVALLALLPAAYLVVRASDAGWGGALGIATSPRSVDLLIRTAGLAVAVTAGAIAVGVPLAWLTTRSDLPGRRLWVVLLTLPLAIPSFIGAFTFSAALGPKGLVQGWLEPLGVDRLPPIFGFPGAWLVLTLFTYPYVFLIVRSALRNLDPSLEEASRALGRSPLRTFGAVVLPQLRPAIVSGGLLAALYTLSDFGAVSLMRFDSFTRVIFLQYQAAFDRTPAAVLSLMLVALMVAVLTLEIRLRGRAAYHRVHGGATRRAPVTLLGAWKWPALAGCSLVMTLGLLIPVGVTTFWLVRGLEAGEPLRLTFEAARNSLEVSALGAVVALVLAWPVAVLSARFPGRLSAWVERATYTGYALPGVVVALSLVFFGARYAPSIYQTRTMLVFAYVVLFLPIAVGALRAAVLQVSPSLEDASRSLGVGRVGTLRRVTLPLAGPGVAAGLALVFLTVMKELPATLLLAPTEFSTLATEVWSAANAAFFARAAIPALGLVLLSSLPLAVLVLRERR